MILLVWDLLKKGKSLLLKKFLAIKNLFLEIIPWVLELKKNYGTLENQHLIFAQFSWNSEYSANIHLRTFKSSSPMKVRVICSVS